MPTVSVPMLLSQRTCVRPVPAGHEPVCRHAAAALSVEALFSITIMPAPVIEAGTK
jgi:hypothetical protein